MKKPNILYCGDSPVGGPANYLLAVLKSMQATVHHVSPAKPLKLSDFKKKYDAIILSDYSKKQMSTSIENKITKLVQSGVGLLMVGGWGSYSGPFGGWKGSKIEKLLPVECASQDDRVNFPGGAYVMVKHNHPMFQDLSFKNSPVICGMNMVKPKKGSEVILLAKKVVRVGNHLTWDPVEYPLLTLRTGGQTRTAAFATDFAPHWCGGLVDWGDYPRKLPVTKIISVEVGESYISFITALLSWVAFLD